MGLWSGSASVCYHVLTGLKLASWTPKASKSPGEIADAFVLAFLLRSDHGVDADADDDDDDDDGGDVLGGASFVASSVAGRRVRLSREQIFEGLGAQRYDKATDNYP